MFSLSLIQRRLPVLLLYSGFPIKILENYMFFSNIRKYILLTTIGITRCFAHK